MSRTQPGGNIRPKWHHPGHSRGGSSGFINRIMHNKYSRRIHCTSFDPPIKASLLAGISSLIIKTSFTVIHLSIISKWVN